MPDNEAAPTAQPQVIHVGSNLPLPSALQLKGNSSVHWKRFRQAWDNYEIAARLKTKDKEFRTATLLTCIGQDALDIYDGLAFDEEAHKKHIDIVLQKLEEFCVGNKNEIYERYLFSFSAVAVEDLQLWRAHRQSNKGSHGGRYFGQGDPKEAPSGE